MKEKGLTCSWVLKIIVLRSNYICLSSFTALLRLKRKLYAVCYLPDYSLKHAFIAYKYRCRARHSADNLIRAIRYPYLCSEHAAFCRLSGCMRCGCYHTIGRSVCFCIVAIKFDVYRHSFYYRIHIFIRNDYCSLMGICHQRFCDNCFGVWIKYAPTSNSTLHRIMLFIIWKMPHCYSRFLTSSPAPVPLYLLWVAFIL